VATTTVIEISSVANGKQIVLHILSSDLRPQNREYYAR
jgi:hypothetical protein